MKPDTAGHPGGEDAARPPRHAAGRVTGLCADGLLLTAAGERPVGDLRPGDRVITRDAGMVTLRGLARRRIDGPMVCIRAGALGHRRPGRDTLLPACQPILLRDWRAQALFGRSQVLVAAARLADGEFVLHAGTRTHDLCELDFGAPHILYLDGLEVANRPATAQVA